VVLSPHRRAEYACGVDVSSIIVFTRYLFEWDYLRSVDLSTALFGRESIDCKKERKCDLLTGCLHYLRVGTSTSRAHQYFFPSRTTLNDICFTFTSGSGATLEQVNSTRSITFNSLVANGLVTISNTVNYVTQHLPQRRVA
jgi:hypothetical protein